MATDVGTRESLQHSRADRMRELKGRLFEVVLLAATLVGIVSLLILFGYIAFDAFRPLTASTRWYLLYFGSLVAPTAAYTLYARQNSAVRAVNTRAFAVVFGAATLSLVTYAVADAVSPYDVLLYAAFGGLPPILLYGYMRSTGRRATGPALPVSVVLGLGTAALLYEPLRPIVGIAAEWVAYLGFTTIPVAAILCLITVRQRSTRGGVLIGTMIVGGSAVLAAVLLSFGQNPAFWVVLFSVGLVPVGYVIGHTLTTHDEGRVGLLGPFILIGGVLLGAALERSLGIEGLNGYLTPSLIVNSWNGLNASNAGVYPQIVGSLVIVGFMAVLAFPLGIGAAVYLEEYAPRTGWGGRLATVLEVNISNLAGVPSVVYGLLGLALFRNALGFGTGIVASASGTLALLILPIVVVSAQEAIRSVPASLREASYGMGASRWQTLRRVVFPEAIPGILTGTILALARAIGETAPLVIIAVATTTYTPPAGLFSSATALPLQIFAARSNVDPGFRHGVVPAAAVILLVLMLVMNATAVVVRNRYERDR